MPPDARFCHKCGKPLFELVAQDETPATPVVDSVATPQQPAPPPEISFHNAVAVRTALLTSIVGSVLWQLPISPQLVWLLASLTLVGFLAVFFYQRRTGQTLSVRSGARMGWITGVFSFVIALILFTGLMLALSDAQGFAAFQKEMRAQLGQSQDLDRAMEAMKEPGMMSIAIVTGLVMLFVMFTVFPTLGGVIGAKVLERDRA
ncbi:MAG: hypothetical protein HY820_22755 [Acidobacteria bacterium]|nr:hypothetical protein [Acidobacteriota bacterium]